MRIALGIQYEGTHYHGWQKQNNLKTVQSEVECALTKVANHEVSIYGSSRTDAGVHAYYQVAHFDTVAPRSETNWLRGVNRYLPDDIKLIWAKQVDDDFHARFSAMSREYKYIILNTTQRSCFWRNFTLQYSHILNVENMAKATTYLLGEHDFQALRGSDCQSKTTIREVISTNITKNKNFIIFQIRANAFLHHMVRKIVGVLLQIGEGKYSPSWINEVIESKDNTNASFIASASGLFLYDVEYEKENYADLNRSSHINEFLIQ